MIRITYNFVVPNVGATIDVQAVLVRRRRWRTMPESGEPHWSVATWRGWVLALFLWGRFPASMATAPRPVEEGWYDRMIGSAN